MHCKLFYINTSLTDIPHRIFIREDLLIRIVLAVTEIAEINPDRPKAIALQK